MHRSPLIILALLILTVSPGRAVRGPVYQGHPDDGSAPAAKPPPVAAPVATPAATPAAAPASTSEKESVDLIKGIGNFKFGALLTDFPPGVLRTIDPKARGILLRVSPYGDNYLVTDITGLTWGNIPLMGLVVTFHEGVLIDMQVALRAKKADFYVADRAFKEKYGPNNPKTLPVETWSGSHIQVTLIFSDAELKDETSLDAMGRGKVEMFDQGRWNKFEADRTAKLNAALNQRYEDSGKKVITNL